uniref:Retrotransposon gag domain-containing protein n=1 Tax=Cannabis sativa TaxID=3483 RepID=A0A803QG37_CANSA
MVHTRGRSSASAAANTADLPSPVDAPHQTPRATPAPSPAFLPTPPSTIAPSEASSSTAPPPSTIAPVDSSLADASSSPILSSPPEIVTENATPNILLPTSRPPRPLSSSPIFSKTLPTGFTPISSIPSIFPTPPPVAPTASPSFPPGFGFFDTPRSWKRASTINLAAKNKTPFIEGTLPRPPVNHPYRSAWDQCNRMVMAWILQFVSREIAASIMFKDSILAMWNNLHDRFNQSNGLRIFHLKTSLIRIKQGTNSVTTYFTQLQSLWDGLNEFQPFTPCSCGCTCGVMQQIQDHYSRDQILQFLTGLNDPYAGARDQILMFEPLALLSKVFSMIVKQERQRSLAPPNAMAAAASSSRPPPS